MMEPIPVQLTERANPDCHRDPVRFGVSLSQAQIGRTTVHVLQAPLSHSVNQFWRASEDRQCLTIQAGSLAVRVASTSEDYLLTGCLEPGKAWLGARLARS